MFSRNGKISEKQLKRMLVLASIMFVVPYVSARMYGVSVLPGLIVFFVLSNLYVLYIYGMGEWYEKSSMTTGKEGYISVMTESGLVGIVVGIIQFARLVFRLAFYIMLAITILKEAQVPFMPKGGAEIGADILVVLPLLLVALYGANTQIEKQGRIHEMIFWVLFVPFIVVILFGLKEVDYEVFIPKVSMSFGNMVLYAYLLLTFVLPIENYLYLKPHVRSEKGAKHICGAVVLVILLSIVITLFMFGIYGVHGAAKEPMVTVAIMRYIRFPFGVLERFDVIMLWFFMTGCFVLICQSLYFAGYIFQKMWKSAKKIWIQLAAVLLALGLVFCMRNYENGLLTFLCYGAIQDIPLAVLLPLLGIVVNKIYVEETEE